MRKLVMAACAALASLTFSASSIAQADRAQFEVAFEAQETRRRAIIAQALELSEEEAAKFWPIYDDYRREVKTIELRLVDNLSSFADNFSALDDSVAEELISKAVDIQADKSRLNREHVKRVRRVLESVDALRYWQLDSYIDTAQKMSVQRQIPLAGTDLEQLYLQQQAAQQR